MPEILMPKLSDSMEQGTILSWLKQTGDQVSVDDELLEIETDKSTVTYSAQEAGTLTTLVEEGQTVEVGTPIARLGAAAETPAPVETAPAPAETAPAPVEAADVAPAPAVADQPPGAAAQVPPAPAANGRPARSAATPLAMRAAEVHSVALSAIQGTGPLGKITRADVLKHAGVEDTPAAAPAAPRPAAQPPAAQPAAPAAATPVPPGSRRLEPSRLQQVIARRMVEAKATVPHFQVQTEVAMDAALALRAELKPLAEEGQPVPSINDIIIKASAGALFDHPLANGSFQDDAFILHDRINIGMAVAADDALVVPTVFDAAGKSLGQIARETRALAQRVRDGQISPAELEGGTFTVSNLGMFGMTAITPVINPPQAAILGVGAARPTLARVDEEIVERQMLTLTLSCDHRILYGADAARFLARIRELLETPLTLAL